MSQPFDPYHRWLGISPQEQPPNFYHLLGIPLFESQPDVIESAADRQMAHLRSVQSGEHAADSQRLLNEVATARVCLLNPAKKAAYDQELQASLGSRMAMSGAMGGIEMIEIPTDPLRATLPGVRRAKPPKKNRTPLAIAAVAVGLLSSLLLLLWNPSGDQPLAHATLAFDWPEGMRRGASLELNGRPQHLPPLGPIQCVCPAGEVEIVALVPGYQPETRTILLTAGERQSIRFDWQEVAAAAARAAQDSQKKTDIASRSVEASDGSDSTPRAARDGRTTEVFGASSSSPQQGSKSAEGGDSASPAAPKRAPVPAEAVQAEIARQIDEVYHTDQAATPSEKLRLAEELTTLAEQTKELREKFVLLRRAAELNSDAGDAEAMLAAIDAIAQDFEVICLTAKEKMLVRFAAGATTPARIESLVEAARQLAQQAVAEDRYDVALHAARVADSACSGPAGAKFRPETGELVRQIERENQRHLQVLQAEAAVKLNPDDAAAHLALGRWHCFAKNDFPRGVPHLAKGSDPLLKRAAEQEMADPKTPDAKIAVGHSWWDAAEKEDPAAMARARSRAMAWYEQVWQAARAPVRAKIAKRMGQVIASAPPNEKPSQEVLRLARLLAGDWRAPQEERAAAKKILAGWELAELAGGASSVDAATKGTGTQPAAVKPKPAPVAGQPIPIEPQLDEAVNAAWNSIASGNATAGRGQLEAAAKSGSEDLRVAFSLGLVDALVKHDWESAERHFGQCVKLQPDHVASLNNLALVRMRLNLERQALRHWETVLSAGPPPAEVSHNLARLRELIQSRRATFRPNIAREIEDLAVQAGAAGYQPGTGFLFMRLVLPSGQTVGWKEAPAYQDRWCVACGGQGEVRCSAGCARGSVKKTVQRQVGVQPITNAPVVQNVTVRTPCPKCKGRGQLDCPQCQDGVDENLKGSSRRSRRSSTERQ